MSFSRAKISLSSLTPGKDILKIKLSHRKNTGTRGAAPTPKSCLWLHSSLVGTLRFSGIHGIALRKERGLLRGRWGQSALPYPACISGFFVLWDLKLWSGAQGRAVVCVRSQVALVLISVSSPFSTLYLPFVPIACPSPTANFPLSLNFFFLDNLIYFRCFLAPEKYSQVQIVCL